mmetsp:Transcript_16116/g.22506  ORF Transcript_16116/g.22506 Transcript_16116/m.22506 type:complete len:106 (-) Transcript_16116:307-624(-)
MVPFGKRAFFPGYLHHTNELLVLLGSNYYVERSAKQASEILDRRIRWNNTQMERIQRKRDHVIAQQKITNELFAPKKATGGEGKVRMGVFDIGGGQCTEPLSPRI